MTDTDLRAALGVAPEPDFELDLPPGWARHRPDRAQQDAMLAGIRTRAMQAHRPELLAQANGMLRDSFEMMRRGDVVAFFTPSEQSEETL